MPLSTEQIEKLSTLFQSKEEADHNMAQSLVETLCDTQEDFESLFLRHKRHLNAFKCRLCLRNRDSKSSWVSQRVSTRL